MSAERKKGDSPENPATLAQRTHALQVEHFRKGATRDLEVRRDALRALLDGLERRENEVLAALEADLGKPAVEAWLAEYHFLRTELKLTIRKLPTWAKPRRAGHPFYFQPARSRIHREPYGTALIVAPWNYPLQLALSPAIAAIAAGNCVTIKPSELAPATSDLLAELVGTCCEPAHVAVVLGEAELGAALLEQAWDHFFFTGGESVGRKVAEAAAGHLAPAVLELGGKSPAVVDWTGDLELAAERIAFGKFVNAGQTCMAPDFVAVPEMHYDEFTGHLDRILRQSYAGGNPELARCPNRRHYDRVLSLAGDDATVIGVDDPDSLRLAPRWLQADWDHPAMQEEVFGAVLPVLPYPDRATFIDRLAELPSPLALYVFSDNPDFADLLIRRFRSGSVCVNDVMKQAINPELPFGGVGPSGHGRYRGRHGFDTFTFTRPVTRRPQWPDPFSQAPPYGDLLDRLRRFLR